MTYTPFVFARTITPDMVDGSGRVAERSLVTLCESARMETLALLGWSSRYFLEELNLNVVLARIQGELIRAPELFEPVLLVVALSKLGAGSLSLLHEIRGQDGSLCYRLRIVEGCFDRAARAVTLLHEDMKRVTRPALLPPNWEFNEETRAALPPIPPVVGLTLIATPPEVPTPSGVLQPPEVLQPLRADAVLGSAPGAGAVYHVRVNFAHTEQRGGRCREDAFPLFCDQAFAAYLQARGLLPQVGAACPWVVRAFSGKITASPALGTPLQVTLSVQPMHANLVQVTAQISTEGLVRAADLIGADSSQGADSPQGAASSQGADSPHGAASSQSADRMPSAAALLYEQEAQLEVTTQLFHGLGGRC